MYRTFLSVLPVSAAYPYARRSATVERTDAEENPMTLELPRPIADYVEANARLDLEGMLETFAADAVFIDNGGRHEGHAGIRALLEEAVIPARAIFTPETVRDESGQVVVEGPAHGDFPGSPIRFTYRFTLEGDRITALDVTA
jgi:hypothetical protein